jgi:uncharacterized membrane protein YhaH (DUF805 family)
MSWFMQALKNYAAFEGRARRKEFWFFVLFFVIALIVASIIDRLIGLPILTIIVSLGLIIPSISVSVRRLHDTGRSGWWYLISLIPIVGLVLIVFYVLDSKPETNAYGPSPKAA